MSAAADRLIRIPALKATSARCYSELRADEVCYSYIHKADAFSAYRLRDLLSQIAEWQRLGAKALDCNVKEIDVAGSKAWLFVVQPAVMVDTPLSPLAMAHGLLVSGYAYIAKDKGTADLVLRALA